MKNLINLYLLTLKISSLLVIIFLSQSSPLKAQEKVKIKLYGEEVYVFDSSRIEIKNNNSNIFIGNLTGSKTKLFNSDPNYISGRYNTFVGDSSGLHNVYGFSNSYYGANTGLLNLNGTDNAIFGAHSYSKDTIGSYNSCLGSAALLNFKNGHSNTAIGAYSGVSLISGNQNTLIGYAGSGIQSGNNNVLIGNEAGADSVIFSMDNSICIGNYAGYGNHSSNKLFISNSTSATVNPLIYGDFANDSIKIYGTLSIGDEYSFPTLDGVFGQALLNNGNGKLVWSSLTNINALNDLSDVLTDYSSKFNMIAGNGGANIIPMADRNTGFGADALRELTSGKRNTTFGASSLYLNNTGDKNNAFGAYALAENESGDNNIAIGESSSFKNVSGSENICFGSSTNLHNLLGSKNTIIGHEAGYGLPGVSKTGSVMIGYQAGYSETDDNKLYIDNSSTSTPLIYGDFSNDSLQINGKARLNCTNSIYDFVMTEVGDEPVLIPSEANYGYIGTSDKYLYRIYSSQFYAASAANYLNWSDRRLKENIQTLDGASDRIMQLQPVKYDLKEDFYAKGRNLSTIEMNRRFNQSGFIAQNLEQIYPNMVMTDKNTNLKAVSYVALIPEMVSVIQGQQAKINDLEKKLETIMELVQKK